VNEKLKIKNSSAFYSILGLAFLLLFSPCKVRNYVQAELGLPITEVANKSKTTISNANCNSFENSETAIASSSKAKASTKENLFIKVENNLGISIVPTSLQLGYAMHVKFIELNRFKQRTLLSVAWNTDNRNPILNRILSKIITR